MKMKCKQMHLEMKHKCLAMNNQGKWVLLDCKPTNEAAVMCAFKAGDDNDEDEDEGDDDEKPQIMPTCKN